MNAPSLISIDPTLRRDQLDERTSGFKSDGIKPKKARWPSATGRIGKSWRHVDAPEREGGSLAGLSLCNPAKSFSLSKSTALSATSCRPKNACLGERRDASIVIA